MRNTIRPLRNYRTFGKSRAVRLAGHDYAQDIPTHLTLCADAPVCTRDGTLARAICDDVEFYCTKLVFGLFGFCLMPDHLHVLLSPAQSGVPVDHWLQSFKSHTTNLFMKTGHPPPLWQRSACDHVCRNSETAETVLIYIVNNPVRAGRVNNWKDWPWTKVFIEL